MDLEAYVKDYQERAGDGRYGDVVYIAGPIDLAAVDADARHELLAQLVDPSTLIYCPRCVQEFEQSAPLQVFNRNLKALQAADALVVVWDGPTLQPSFGTAVEVTLFGTHLPDRTVVVGTLGPGIIADALRAMGVREVATTKEAVALLHI